MKWTDMEIKPEEVVELLQELTKHFEMDFGYPSTYVLSEEGPEHGVVNDALGLILENALEMMVSMRDDLGMDVDDGEGAIEFELDGDWGDLSSGGDEDE